MKGASKWILAVNERHSKAPASLTSAHMHSPRRSRLTSTSKYPPNLSNDGFPVTGIDAGIRARAAARAVELVDGTDQRTQLTLREQIRLGLLGFLAVLLPPAAFVPCHKASPDLIWVKARRLCLVSCFLVMVMVWLSVATVGTPFADTSCQEVYDMKAAGTYNGSCGESRGSCFPCVAATFAKWGGLGFAFVHFLCGMVVVGEWFRSGTNRAEQAQWRRQQQEEQYWMWSTADEAILFCVANLHIKHKSSMSCIINNLLSFPCLDHVEVENAVQVSLFNCIGYWRAESRSSEGTKHQKCSSQSLKCRVELH
ncbi:hypothetical protein BC830DRAFT_1155820 [Chytriomyces sp. MP71]|nr:hypothetical protein BC830DRAFT_1155820 [Chytriomyces sp. MP71]